MLFSTRRRLAAAAASAIALQAASTCGADAAAVPSPLRSLHEALATGPLGRKYVRASPLGGSLWELSFATQDLRTKSRAAQSQIVDLDRRATDQVTATLPVDGGTVVTRSPEHGLELRQSACEDGKKLAVEVWSASGTRLARRVIEGVGPKVLPTGVFGKPTFSPSGTAVAFVAEKPPEGQSATGYWPPAASKDQTDKTKDKEGAPEAGDGETAMVPGRFALRDARSTGELLLVHNSLMVAWDWRADAVRVLKAEDVLPEGSLPNDGVGVPVHPCFDGTESGLLFACHLQPPWRPGISACLNRPTRLYHLDELWKEDGAASSAKEPTPTGGDDAADAPKQRPARCLTNSLYMSHFPRLSPDGRVLAFLSAPEAFAAHSTVFEVRTMAWPPPDVADIRGDVLLPAYEAMPSVTDGSEFAGVCGFHDELASLSWLDASTLIMNSIAGESISTFTVSVPPSMSDAPLSAASVRPLRPPSVTRGSVQLLGVSGGTAIVQCSSLLSPPTVWAHRDGEWMCLVDVASLLDAGPTVTVQEEGGLTAAARSALGKLCASRSERVALPASSGGATAMVLLPGGAGETANDASRVPWVLRIHGGPHSVSPDAFNLEVAMLLASGVGVILPNYRGSLGFGRSFCEALLGHIGEMDVSDCVALTRASLARFPAELDPSRGAAYGGSHGGFLTAWLLGCDDRELYARGGVLWNPVVDLPAMLGTTDIPEWVAAETLRGEAGLEVAWPLNGDQLLEMYRRSPISVIDKVDAPALMLLGAADQRVPHKQGRSWVTALQHVRRATPGAPEVSALEFPNEGHGITSVEGNAHAVQSAIAWLVEKLQAQGPPAGAA